MTGLVINTPALSAKDRMDDILPAHRKRSSHPSPVAPQFSATRWELEALKRAASAGREGIPKKIKHEKMANVLRRMFSLPIFNSDVRVRGMSLEDMSSRFLTLFGLYIPQGYLAIKEKKHIWETNMRNATVWTFTFALTQFIKNDTFGVNSLFLNPFLAQKGKVQKPEAPSSGFFKKIMHTVFTKPVNALQRMVNARFGLSDDYITLLRTVVGTGKGTPEKMQEELLALKDKHQLSDLNEWVNLPTNPEDPNHAKLSSELSAVRDEVKKSNLCKKSPWASFFGDQNMMDLASNKFDELEAKGALNELEQKFVDIYPKFYRRINKLSVVSSGLVITANVFITGWLAMQLVYHTFARWDKDFDPTAFKKGKKDKAPPTTAASGGLPSTASSQTGARPPFAINALTAPGRTTMNAQSYAGVPAAQAGGVR